MPHLVLLGDSIFDNARYTSGGPAVESQVRKLLPSKWNLTLLAVDGSSTDDIPGQMRLLPNDATHLVLSVGGNDALTYASRLGFSLFGIPGTPDSNTLDSLARIYEDFERQYHAVVDICLRPGLPLVLCTIYNGCFPDKAYQRLVPPALAVFNDVILRVAIAQGLRVIDLRSACKEAADYANPIEPSSIGGEKIAQLIVASVTGPDDQRHGTRIFARP
jgi:hypothetical protein